jgi:hypothetical protein
MFIVIIYGERHAPELKNYLLKSFSAHGMRFFRYDLHTMDVRTIDI